MSSPTSSSDLQSFWQSHVSACQLSSLSKAQYCRENQLEYHQLIYWYAKFCEKTASASSNAGTPKFLPVSIEQSARAPSLQITLPNGVVIEGITERSVHFIGEIVRQL
jgi:hypothetical protein